MDNAACASIVAVFGSCFGNNAAAPYIVPQLPIDGTAVNPYYAAPFTQPGVTGAPSNMIYRLRDTDALVTLVSLPPTAAYLGYQGYLLTRDASNYSEPDPMTKVSPDPTRWEIFGSFGNDINNVILGERLGRIWNKGVAVYITTSNRQLADALIADAQAKGFDRNRIFVEPVGANVLTGASPSSDDMVTLMRYALPKDDAAGAAWVQGFADNVQVFRVGRPAIPVTRFGAPSYTKKVAISEAAYQGSLDELGALLKDWLLSQEARPVLIEAMTSSEHVDPDGTPHGLVGADCIEKGSNCLGDNQDTDAYRIGVIGLLTGNNLAFVAGVNHSRTDNAHYTSLAIYDIVHFTGVASASQSNPKAVGFNKGSLTGSASGILKALGIHSKASPKLKSQLADLYVSMLSRQCGGATKPYCIEIGTDVLPEQHPIAVTQRAYLKPGQSTGGNPDALLPPILVFRLGP